MPDGESVSAGLYVLLDGVGLGWPARCICFFDTGISAFYLLALLDLPD